MIDYAVCTIETVYDSIIVPTDGSEAAETAVDHGVSQASAHDARLIVLAVVETSGTASPEGRSEAFVEMGVPSRVILEQARARGADLLVMATRARSGVGRFLYGSVTEQVIRDGDTPVLAVQR